MADVGGVEDEVVLGVVAPPSDYQVVHGAVVDWESLRAPLAAKGIDLDDPKVLAFVEAFDALDDATQRKLLGNWRRVLGL